MPIIEENKPFKDCEDVKAEIRKCDLFGSICQYACFIFAALARAKAILLEAQSHEAENAGKTDVDLDYVPFFFSYTRCKIQRALY